MAKQSINIGTVANDGTGDTLRNAHNLVNANFEEIYNALGFEELVSRFMVPNVVEFAFQTPTGRFGSNGNIDINHQLFGLDIRGNYVRVTTDSIPTFTSRVNTDGHIDFFGEGLQSLYRTTSIDFAFAQVDFSQNTRTGIYFLRTTQQNSGTNYGLFVIDPTVRRQQMGQESVTEAESLLNTELIYTAGGTELSNITNIVNEIEWRGWVNSVPGRRAGNREPGFMRFTDTYTDRTAVVASTLDQSYDETTRDNISFLNYNFAPLDGQVLRYNERANRFEPKGVSLFSNLMPMLGGDLDTNGFALVSVNNRNYEIDPAGTQNTNITNADIIGANAGFNLSSTGNIVPIGFDNDSSFPDATTYEGAFAVAIDDVTSSQDDRLYFAHDDVWKRVLRRDTFGGILVGDDISQLSDVDTLTSPPNNGDILVYQESFGGFAPQFVGTSVIDSYQIQDGAIVPNLIPNFSITADKLGADIITAEGLQIPIITGISPTAVTPGTFTITATGFNILEGARIELQSTTGRRYTTNRAITGSGTSIVGTFTNVPEGNYYVNIENPTGLTARLPVAGLNVSTGPIFITDSNLGVFERGVTLNLIIDGYSDSTVRYELLEGELPTGLSLVEVLDSTKLDSTIDSTVDSTINSYILLSGTESSGLNDMSRYTFTIRATDAEGQITDKIFYISFIGQILGGLSFN